MTRFEPDDTGVLRFAAELHDRGLRATVGALRDALAASDGGHLRLAPHGVPAPDGDGRSTATARPVTDAVKQVAGGLLVGTVDRGPLRWVTAPAVLRGDELERALAGRADTDVVEPLVLVAPLEVWP